MTHRSVKDLQDGDIVTNLGTVERYKKIGVFIVVGIRVMVWSLASGTGESRVVDMVWHESALVAVDGPS